MTTPTRPHVAILLCTRNGARFLPDQLASYLAQDHDDWSLWVSDDGSTDDTLAILNRFRADHPDRDVTLFRGPKQGIGANFLSLICRDDVPGGMMALSDQDDVWLPDKLSRGVAMLGDVGQGRATLYASAYRTVDARLRDLGSRARPARAFGFREALYRNRYCGATMMLPEQTIALARRIGPRAVPFHDWWLTQIVTGVGGEVLYDPEPSMLYRQHGDNALGANLGALALLRRMGLVANGAYRDWQAINRELLNDIWYELDPAQFQQLKRRRRGRQTASSSTTLA